MSKLRFPELTVDRMTDEQKKVVSEIAQGPRRAVSGPFLPLLHAPELASKLQAVGAYLRFESSLPRDLFETAVLYTAWAWQCDHEWNVHKQLARTAGVTDETIESIRKGSSLSSPGPLGIALRLCDEIYRDRTISDSTYEQCSNHFGLQGILELLTVCGYYSTLAMILNTSTGSSTINS